VRRVEFVSDANERLENEYGVLVFPLKACQSECRVLTVQVHK
jgi:hypothetical protein